MLGTIEWYIVMFTDVAVIYLGNCKWNNRNSELVNCGELLRYFYFVCSNIDVQLVCEIVHQDNVSNSPPLSLLAVLGNEIELQALSGMLCSIIYPV